MQTKYLYIRINNFKEKAKENFLSFNEKVVIKLDFLILNTYFYI